MLAHVADDNPELAGEHAEALHGWIERGGFLPTGALTEEFTSRSLLKFLTVVMDLAVQASRGASGGS